MGQNAKIHKNLNELLKSSGYEEGDSTANNFAPHLAELSRPVLRRVRVLKKYQLESLQIESEFYQKVHELEKEFQSKFDVVNAKRKAVVTGEIEPTEPDSELPALLHDITPDELEKLECEAPVEGGEPSKGIPGFWFHTLNNIGQISDTIKEYDEPILMYLKDVVTQVHTEPAGFSLIFHFAENPFFSNETLTKYYQMEVGLNAEEPFDYDGPTVLRSEGTEILWKDGKNVTQKIVKKKQKKGPQAGKYTTKMVPNESFFNFFDSATKVINPFMDADEEEKIREDFELGQVIRDQVIPRAVLFFTGEAADDDDWGDMEDEDEDEEEGPSDDDE